MTDGTKLEARRLLVKIATLTAEARSDFQQVGADPVLMQNLVRVQHMIDQFKRLVSVA